MTDLGTPVSGIIGTQMSVVVMMTMISRQTQCAVDVTVDNLDLNSVVNIMRMKINFDRF